VAVEIVGAVDKVKQILGVPVSRPLKLTTFKEAANMITELKSDGLNNMSVKLTGWTNGGIQQKISMWLHGAQTEVNVTQNNEDGYGGYTFTYTQEGETKELGVGGVSLDEDGNETWMSADELAEGLSKSADIDVDEDGRVWIYYYDQKIDVTDSFDENGVCSLTLTHDDETVSLEITKDEDGGYSFMQTSISGDNGGSAGAGTVEEPGTSISATTYYGITDGR